MNEPELFEAIGHADEKYLKELENRKTVELRRPLWRVGLVAALIALLAVTSIAATNIISALTGGETYWSDELYPYVSIYGPGAEGMTDGHRVVLEIDVDPNAPATLETPCVPTVLLENHPAGRCVWESHGAVYWCKYYYDNGKTDDIRFEQYAIPEDGDGKYYAIVRSISGAKKESRMFEVGNIQVMEITFTGWFDLESMKTVETRQLYWSDGMYIYYLLLPYDVDAEFYESVIASVQPVADTGIFSESSNRPSPTPTDPE